MKNIPYKVISFSLLVYLGITNSFAQVFMCNGNDGVPEYTNAKIKDKECKEVNLPKITTMPSAKNINQNNIKRSLPPNPFSFGANLPLPSFPTINPNIQNERDDERKNILQKELDNEQKKLQELQTSYNNGLPERQGGEKNYQKYLDRVEQMKKDIMRAQGNTEALKKELGIK